MKKLGIIIAVLLAVVMLLFTIDDWHSHSLRKRALSLRTGDSKQRVESVLGKPITIFMPSPQARTNFLAALLSVRSETWAYGNRLDLRLAFHGEIPVCFRWFGPGSNDVAVVFDSSGRVAQITVP
jgi:hypothetical protein